MGLKRYMLIRVGLDVREDEWFGVDLRPPEAAEGSGFGEEPNHGMGLVPEQRPKDRSRRGRRKQGARTESGQRAEQETETETGWSGLLHPLRYLRLCMAKGGERRCRERGIRAQEQERERLLAERKERILQTDMAVERLAREVLELTEDRGSCRLVYEGALQKTLAGAPKCGGALQDQWALRQEQENRGEAWQERKSWEGKGAAQGELLSELWKKHFDMEEFQEYRQRFWIERLLPYARLCHYVILGTAPCIYQIIEDRAQGMKSLRWMLLEADCDQELWDFVEDFYTEYGLAIELRTFESEESFRRQKALCSQPANIIDFTGDICFSVTEAAEGSIWLDMLSSEEKRYRIQGRRTGVEYVSLKEEWKRAKRRCAAPEW